MKKYIFSKNLIIGILLFITVFSWSFPNVLIKKGVLGISYSITDGQFMDKINFIRKQNGLSPLNLNNKLSLAATEKAKDMVARNYWSHFGPTGTSPWYFINKNNYKYVYAGENLAKGYTNIDEVFNSWMNSDTHKKNILSVNYKDTGFAMVTGNLNGESTTIIVEIFASSNKIQ